MNRPTLLLGVLTTCAFAPLACSSTADQPAKGTGDSGIDETGSMEDAGAADVRPDVPLPPFVMASHPPYPQVPKRGNGTLAPMRLVTISAAGDPFTVDFGQFTTAIVKSKWFTTVGQDYALGTPSPGTAIVGASIPASSISSNGMENYIANSIAGTPALAPNGRTMYMLFLPPGVGEQMDPTCAQFGGYHKPYGNGGDAWGFVQRCKTPPGLSAIQWLTVAASHEIIEAATDVSFNGWAFPGASPAYTGTVWETLLSEVGDLCVNTQIAEGLFTYQRVWSNSAAASSADPCLPVSPKPFYNSAPPAGAGGRGWFPIGPSGSVTVPVLGFSTARMDDWVVSGAVTKSSPTGFTVKITSPTSTTIRGMTYQTINNGVTAMMTITAPSGARSGDMAELLLVNELLTGPAGGDPYHLWPVGVYVP